MRIIQDSRGRPALWLFCVFCISAVCFWYPFFVTGFSDDPYFSRIVTGISISFLPVGLLGSIVAPYVYLVLWRRTWNYRDAAFRLLLSVGFVFCLLALGPALFITLCLILALLC